jgi:hypothetical protein
MPRRETNTIDPQQITSASQIPPPNAQAVGLSPQGLVEVSCGTIPGDIDAQPAAKELLASAVGTSGLSNADYIYQQVSAIYGRVDLPNLSSPSGNTVRSLVFVSGSPQGGFGAFHIGDGATQALFDRIVTDSLNASGNYSAGSALGSALAPIAVKLPHLFAASRGPADLLGIIDTDDARLKAATSEAIRFAHGFAVQSIRALAAALEARNPAANPHRTSSHAIRGSSKNELARHLIRANQELLGLVNAVTRASIGRQYLSTALFAAEIVESFQTLTHRADPGRTDGEAVSRVLAFKLAPEISLVPGFNAGVTQQWWSVGRPDFVNVNSENDQSINGNASGVMFLLFLSDYLGIALDEIIGRMPTTDGAPLGQTYVNLVEAHPELADTAGPTGESAFAKMVSLLQQNVQEPDGTLNLPADGNPFPSLDGAKQGGLLSAITPSPVTTPPPVSLAQDAQAALGLEAQIEQQLASLKGALKQIVDDISGAPTPSTFKARGGAIAIAEGRKDRFGYGPPLPGRVATALEQRVVSYRAPQYDHALQRVFWPHVYNELPGSGTNQGRLQVITGTLQAPEAVQITGTIKETKLEPDGDLHIALQPDDPRFPTNQSSAEPPLELEIIYAGPVTQRDARQAEAGYTNPFDISRLTPGTRIQAAGPLIFDRAHGRVDGSGNVQYGLEIHPLAGITVLTDPQPTPQPPGQVSGDIASALGQAGALSQALGHLTALVEKMQGEVHSSGSRGMSGAR